MEKTRLDLENQDYAEFYVELKHKTQKACAELSRQYLTFGDGNKIIQVEQEEDGTTKVKGDPNKVNVDISKIDFTAINEAIILNQVASWSFGEVSRAVMEELSEANFNKLVEKANGLYSALPLARSGDEN